MPRRSTISGQSSNAMTSSLVAQRSPKAPFASIAESQFGSRGRRGYFGKRPIV